MGVGAAQKLAFAQSRNDEIGDILRLTRNLINAIDAMDGVAEIENLRCS